MTETKRFSYRDLVKVIERAEAYANRERSLTEDEVRDIGGALSIPREALDRALSAHNAESVTEKRSKVILQSRPAFFAALGRRPGLTGAVLFRLGIVAVAGLVLGRAALYGGPAHGMVGSVLPVAIVGAFVAFYSWKVLRTAFNRSAIVAVPNRVVVDNSTLGSHRAIEGGLEGLSLEVRKIEDTDGGYDVSPIYRLIALSREGWEAELFVGLPSLELEAIRSAFYEWRAAADGAGGT